jgi:ubiquitin-protein ligase
VAWDSSIFLRVDETRVDVIKALITGPEGTPYVSRASEFAISSHLILVITTAGTTDLLVLTFLTMFPGSYLFDIFLGPSYNQSPPSVKYMTVSGVCCILEVGKLMIHQTNGGKYRFNPNLYAVRQIR